MKAVVRTTGTIVDPHAPWWTMSQVRGDTTIVVVSEVRWVKTHRSTRMAPCSPISQTSHAMVGDPNVDKKVNVAGQHAHETHDEMVGEIGIQTQYANATH